MGKEKKFKLTPDKKKKLRVRLWKAKKQTKQRVTPPQISCAMFHSYADNTLMDGVCFVLMRAIVAYPIWRKMSHRTTHAHDFIPEFEDCLFFFLLFSFYLFHFLFLLFFPEGAFLPHKNTHQEFRILYFM